MLGYRLLDRSLQYTVPNIIVRLISHRFFLNREILDITLGKDFFPSYGALALSLKERSEKESNKDQTK